MRIAGKWVGRGAVATAILLAAGCGDLSKVGDQTEPTPKAIVTALGQPYTTDSSGTLTTTVRAGSDVALSGKDSEKGADDTGVPLINFKWEQVSAGSNPVTLIYRTANTVSFTAPQVKQDTTLTFKLTVADAKGVTASANAQVLVKPIRDSNHFLQFLTADNTFKAVFTTQSAIAANAGALATDTLPITVKLTKLVTFTDRNGVVRTQIPVGNPVSMTASWSASVGTSTSCNDAVDPTKPAYQNPTLLVPIPRVDLDDVLASSVPSFPDAILLSDVMEASDIDGVTLEVRVDLSSTNTTVSGAVPEVCVNGSATGIVGGTVVSTESLYVGNQPRDSKAAAQAYYDTIDPAPAQKDTLNKWLTVNGFNSSVLGWGADAHAVYANNYDLGFGRDMYLKFGTCDAGTATLPLAQRIGHCDVAAIVVNYADVETTAKKLNPVIAVAMEYSAAPGTTSPRFVKFYTYAPDTRTGDYKRVLSVNLDRRGEQFLPQACVVCHGGTPAALAAGVYPNNGNVNAGFLPWDLDSLLYSDTDPGFSTKSRNDSLRAQFTRTLQEPQLKMLNQGAYLTYDDPAASQGRYALARELLEKWYGGSGLPNATYSDTTVPDGWLPAGVNNNPVDSDKIYHNVFARNCRSCHVLQVPKSGDPRTASVTVKVNNVDTSIVACSNDSRAVNTSVGIASQEPMGCYWEFAHAPNLADRLSGSQMPFARRTMDRMWIDPLTVAGASSQTAGQIIQAHLLTLPTPLTATTPGTPAAGITSGPATADVDDVVTVDATKSLFAESITWNVDACSGTPTTPGTCNRALSVVGSTGPIAKFTVDNVITYRITQTLNSGQPVGVSYFQVVDKPLVMVASPAAVSFQIGGSGTLPAVISSLGNGSVSRHTMVLTPSTGFSVAPAACATSGCPADTVVTIDSSVTVQTAGTIGVSVTDAGGETQTTTVNVTAQSSFSASNLTLAAVTANAAAATSFDVLTAARASLPPSVRPNIAILSLTYSGARSPTWSFDGTNLTYKPSAGFATHDVGGTQNNSSIPLEVFAYTLKRTDTNEVSPTPATITIPVKARVTFTAMRETWNGTACNGCHVAAGSAPDIGSMTYAAIKAGHLTLSPPGTAYVDVSNFTNIPANSGLLCWPFETCTGTGAPFFHGGGARTALELDVVRKWLEDGANNF